MAELLFPTGTSKWLKPEADGGTHQKKSTRGKATEAKKMRGQCQLGRRASGRVAVPVSPTWVSFSSHSEHWRSRFIKLVVSRLWSTGIKAMAVRNNFLVVVKTGLKELAITAKSWKQSKCPLTANWLNWWYRLVGLLGLVGIKRNSYCK